MVSLISTLAGVVGCIFIFINSGITLICSAVTIACSFIDVGRGVQKGLSSEFVSAGLGILIAVLTGGDWLTGAAIGLCIESVLLWIVGIVYTLVVGRRR